MNYPKNYEALVYAGWLGKIIGVRHGANVENWTSDKIERAFGTVEEYIFDFTHFASDDDINGPAFFLRSLLDFPIGHTLTAEDMGKTWLNYIADNHGFFWWGGYGISTEDTAFQNLVAGIKAPMSGAKELNSLDVAEQIGGQIFSDIWGLVAPNDLTAAADLSAKMASVSHDQNGIYGGIFIAACVAAAFNAESIDSIISQALAHIPEDSTYAHAVRSIIDFHAKHPNDWKACLAYIQAEFNYDTYLGVCHIIPNTCIIILSLLYGQGNFSDTINIGVMCGWDTDCNVGNLGAILGVYVGLDGIDPKWITPMNDFVACSSLIGSRNISDIATMAQLTVAASHRYFEQTPLETTEDAYNFTFDLPYATHGFKLTRNDSNTPFTFGENIAIPELNRRGLKAVFPNISGGSAYQIYHQTYYQPKDFDDARYDPSFSPTVYPGQTITAQYYVPTGDEETATVRLYALDITTGTYHYSAPQAAQPGTVASIIFDTPTLDNAIIGQVGVEFAPHSNTYVVQKNMIAYLLSFTVTGAANFTHDFATSFIENWQPLHTEVATFTRKTGIWDLQNDTLFGGGLQPALTITGDHNFADYTYTATVTPTLGREAHGLLYRFQGGMRYYKLILAENTVQLVRVFDDNTTLLHSVNFAWELDTSYAMTITGVGNTLTVSIGDTELFTVTDTDALLWGQFGFYNGTACATAFGPYEIRGE